ncbi:MAG: energy transducer TonB [Pseudomonadota bacterium]
MEASALTFLRCSTRVFLPLAMYTYLILTLAAQAQSVSQAYDLLVRAQILEQPCPEVESWEAGSARVSYDIGKDGQVTRIAFMKSSVFDIVDKSAMAMVRAASPFTPPPENAPRTFSIEIQALNLRDSPQAPSIGDPQRGPPVLNHSPWNFGSDTALSMGFSAQNRKTRSAAISKIQRVCG